MKRRILFIHNNLGGGGAEGALIEVLNHLDYSRYDVTLFCFTVLVILLTGYLLKYISNMSNLVDSSPAIKAR